MANSGTGCLQVSLCLVSEAEPVGGRHQVPLESGPLGRPLGNRGKVVATSTWVIETATSVCLRTMGMMEILFSLTEVQEDGTNPRATLRRGPAAVLAMFVSIPAISPIFTLSLGSAFAHLSATSLVWPVSLSSLFRSGLF